MHRAVRQPLCRKCAEVFDVVRYRGPAFAACDLEDDPVAAPSQVLAVGDGVYVIAGLAQQDRDLRRQLLVQEGSRERRACSPAAAAARPRSFSRLVQLDFPVDLVPVLAVVGHGASTSPSGICKYSAASAIDPLLSRIVAMTSQTSRPRPSRLASASCLPTLGGRAGGAAARLAMPISSTSGVCVACSAMSAERCPGRRPITTRGQPLVFRHSGSVLVRGYARVPCRLADELRVSIGHSEWHGSTWDPMTTVRRSRG